MIEEKRGTHLTTTSLKTANTREPRIDLKLAKAS